MFKVACSVVLFLRGPLSLSFRATIALIIGSLSTEKGCASERGGNPFLLAIHFTFVKYQCSIKLLSFAALMEHRVSGSFPRRCAFTIKSRQESILRHAKPRLGSIYCSPPHHPTTPSPHHRHYSVAQPQTTHRFSILYTVASLVAVCVLVHKLDSFMPRT